MLNKNLLVGYELHEAMNLRLTAKEPVDISPYGIF